MWIEVTKGFLWHYCICAANGRVICVSNNEWVRKRAAIMAAKKLSISTGLPVRIREN